MLPPRCYDVTQDPSGRVYVATYFGVHLLQADGLALLPNQTNNNNTFSLLATRDGTVYSGRGFDLNGLRVFRDGAVAPLPSLELNNLAAGAMVETQDGKLWLTSRSGLFLFDGLSCSEISGEEGIPGRSFWPILDTQDGDLWLGGLGSGLIRLRRDDFEPPQTSNLSVDYSPSSERWVARWEACDAWNRTTPDRLRFIVQVDDEPWSQPFRGQEYWLPANLDYGRHQIRVQAVDDFGNLEAAPPSAAIQVPVPAYAQPQVLAAAGALFGALLLLASATIQRGRALRRQERRQRTELAASESHYRSLVEHAQMVLAHFDARGRLEYLSPKALDLTGFTVEEFMVDRKLFDRRTHSQYLETLKEFQHRRENGIQEPLEGEVRWRHRDGTWRWLHTRQEPRLNKAGELLGFDSITVDVTATRRAEAAMRETQKLESLGMLAGGIAHDFNNLLVGILGNADLLRESSRYDPMLRDALDDIEEASRQASELCQQMLAYAGRAGLEKTAVDLSALTEEVLNLLPAQWGHSLALDIDLAVGLPALVGDAVQIRQVIMNLVLNAREALQEPGGNIAIRTGVTDLTADRLRDCVVGHDQSPGRYVYISVHDDGVGMDEEVRMRIFDPFYTTKFKGRGLGLAAVLGIIRGHRGVLELETAVGSGTRFVVYWPASNRPTPSRPSRHPLEPFRGQGTVLVIDDEEVVRRVAERMLGMLGFSVLTATNGREGIRMFQSHQNEIRAVLLDVTMPDLDGTEVLQNLKEQKADLPVLLSSGYSEKETLERLTAEVLRNNSRTAFLPKPWDLSLLRRRLQQLLRETTTFSPES
jgi:PAS domain S-box-containing protein